MMQDGLWSVWEIRPANGQRRRYMVRQKNGEAPPEDASHFHCGQNIPFDMAINDIHFPSEPEKKKGKSVSWRIFKYGESQSTGDIHLITVDGPDWSAIRQAAREFCESLLTTGGEIITIDDQTGARGQVIVWYKE